MLFELNSMFLVFLLLLEGPCEGFLNIEELNEAKYALDILNRPLNEIEINPTEGLKLASRHGQNYYCKLPPVIEKPIEKEEEKIPKNTPVAKLLEPMRHDSCLKTIKGWWTYEFCYGKYVKQYHSVDDGPQNDITYLGYYESDFDWNKEVSSDSHNFKLHKLNGYHSQSYVNGTGCDIINHKRDTEIRYICDDSSSETYIERVDEPSTCSYIITVRTPYICSHPYTKPLRNPKPVEIVCQPILASEDYNKFTEIEAAGTKKAPEVEQPVSMSKNDADLEGSDGMEEDSLAYKHMVSMMDGLFPSKNKNEEKEKASEAGDEINQKKLKEAAAVSMIERFVVKERLERMDSFRQKLLLMNVVDLLNKYEKLPTADLARNIEKYVSGFLGDIEDQAKSEYDLLENHDKIAEAIAKEFMEKMGNPDELMNEIPSNFDKIEKEKPKKKKSPVVRLKVQKINSVKDLTNIKPEDITDNSDVTEQNDPSWKKLEEEIGKGLEEAGFETEGNQLEIRIMTNADNFNDVISLSSEEGLKFRSMLLELVAGGSAMTSEVKKQKELHDNYNLVWKKEDSGFTSLSTFDEDSVDDTEGQVRSPKL